MVKGFEYLSVPSMFALMIISSVCLSNSQAIKHSYDQAAVSISELFNKEPPGTFVRYEHRDGVFILNTRTSERECIGWK